jgi:hypothetical protein
MINFNLVSKEFFNLVTFKLAHFILGLGDDTWFSNREQVIYPQYPNTKFLVLVSLEKQTWISLASFTEHLHHRLEQLMPKLQRCLLGPIESLLQKQHNSSGTSCASLQNGHGGKHHSHPQCIQPILQVTLTQK